MAHSVFLHCARTPPPLLMVARITRLLFLRARALLDRCHSPPRLLCFALRFCARVCVVRRAYFQVRRVLSAGDGDDPLMIDRSDCARAFTARHSGTRARPRSFSLGSIVLSFCVFTRGSFCWLLIRCSFT